VRGGGIQRTKIVAVFLKSRLNRGGVGGSLVFQRSTQSLQMNNDSYMWKRITGRGYERAIRRKGHTIDCRIALQSGHPAKASDEGKSL